MSTNGYTRHPAKNAKIWLWIIGWILIFPLPLTILLRRNRSIPKTPKKILIILTWLVYFSLAVFCSEDDKSSKNTARQIPQKTESRASETTPTATPKTTLTEVVKELKIKGDRNISIKEEEMFSEGVLEIKGNLSAEDISFVSGNTEIASVEIMPGASGNMLSYKIIGHQSGETDIHAETKDGSVKSENVHITVRATVKTIDVEVGKTELVLGETIQASANALPDNAEDRTITWSSSDSNIATVNASGLITAIEEGSATITASSPNGTSNSFDVTVDGTQAMMRVTYTNRRTDDVHIGDQWSYNITINNNRIDNPMCINAGEEILFSAVITEDDTNPDVGSASTSYVVTEDDIRRGFAVSLELDVTENGGRNSGQSAHFVVTYTFTPMLSANK